MSSRRGVALLIGAVLAAGALGAAPVSLARFTAAVNRAGTFGTATLVPPTNLAGTGGTTASLTWTASTSTGASGYRVLRSATSGSGFGQVSSVTPVTATSTNDNPAAGTWYYVLRTYFAGWTSANSNQVSVVVTPATTTTGAIRARARATPPRPPTPATTTATSRCPGTPARSTAASRPTRAPAPAAPTPARPTPADKHRWWGYTFGLPATVTSINGITVTPSVGMNNNGGTTWLCVQLSSDGGATWTAAKTAVPTSTGAHGLRARWRDRHLGPVVGDRGLLDRELPGSGDRQLDDQPNKDLRLEDFAVR